MSINWVYFLLTFLLTFLFYHMISAKYKWLVLLISSIIFFILISGYQALILILLTIAISYTGSTLISKSDNPAQKKHILIKTLLFIIGIFILLKTSGVLSQLSLFLSNFFSLNYNIIDKIIIPIGLSYYSLIIIAYVTDVYRGIAQVQTNFFKYSLFILYFPQLMMGPIVRYNEMKDQLYSDKEIDFNCIKFGIFRILWGIAKKIVIADRIALITTSILGNYASYSGLYLLLSIVLFGLQFYIDFSAAMDIVIGASDCFGIKLPENFKNPLFSKSFHEYWTRWHITLNSFFKDYIFYPVIRSEFVSKIKTKLEEIKNKWLIKYIPVFVSYIAVWLVAGLWHGCQTRYMVANCMIPCIFIMLEDIFKPFFQKRLKKHKKIKESIILKPIQMLYVYSFLCFSWFFFNAPTVKDAFNMLSRIIHNFNTGELYNIGTDIPDCIIIFIGIITIFIIDILKELNVDLKKKYVNLPTILRWLILTIMLIIIMLFGLYGPEYNANDFIYFKF